MTQWLPPAGVRSHRSCFLRSLCTRNTVVHFSEDDVCTDNRISQQVRPLSLTQVHHVVAGPVERPGVELQADDGEDDDGKEEEQSDVDQGTDSLGYGGYDDLETWGDKILRK